MACELPGCELTLAVRFNQLQAHLSIMNLAAAIALDFWVSQLVWARLTQTLPESNVNKLNSLEL